jgi:hypothetical protein
MEWGGNTAAQYSLECNGSADRGKVLDVVMVSTDWILFRDHLCGLVVRVPGYRSRGPGPIVERGPLSLLSAIE